jgi:hypothetical protein
MQSNYSIFRLVNESSESLIESIDQDFFSIDLKKILTEANKTFHEYEPRMFIQTKNKLWIEILRTICFYYIRRIINGKKKLKDINELISKLKNDINFLENAFLEKLGENTVKENISNLEKLLEFFECPASMINFSIYTLRQEIGVIFDIDNAKKLFDWRIDFSREEKKSSIEITKEVLSKYIPDEKEKSRKNILADYILMEKINLQNEENEENKDDNKNENLENSENQRKKTLDFSDFLGQIENINIPDSFVEENNIINKNNEEDINDIDKENSSTVDYKLKEKKSFNNEDDVIMEGFMEKKSSV